MEKQVKTGKGYWGKVLHVHLYNNKFEYEDIPEEVYHNYLSGVGLGAKVLWDRLKPGVDPMGSKNILGFTTGILTDTPSLFTGRFTVVGKSPSTGGWGDANCGGYFAPSLKRCGVDAVFFHSRARKPVYLYIDENEARLESADFLWGKDAVETEELLKEKHGKKVQVACIGQSGENLSHIAGISTDKGRLAARSGLGGVMGSKNLKAVVAAGKKRVGAADKDRMRELTKAYRKRLDGMSFAGKYLNDFILGATGWFTKVTKIYPRQPAFLWRLLLKKFGTPCLTAMSAEMGDSPIKNWGASAADVFPLSRSQKIGAEAVCAFEKKKYGCFSCPIQCGGIVKVDKGKYKLEESHKPEYESICAFGGLLLNDDLNSIFKLNDMCNRAGIDTISCGGVVAYAIECFENGIITKEDTGGLALSWGDHEAIIKLTEMIINREGIGDVLADGVKAAAEKIGKGSEKYAVHAGGMEGPMHDPKFDPGHAIAYGFSPTPGRHTVASLVYLEIQELEKHFPSADSPSLITTHGAKHTYHDKGSSVATGVRFKMVADGAGLCLFGTQVGGEMPVTHWLNAATGWHYTPDEYLAAGERIELLRHAFNLREGILPRRDCKPHSRMVGDPPQERGANKGISVDMEAIGRSFYDAMGWDWNTGKPHKDRAEKLGMGDVLEKL